MVSCNFGSHLSLCKCGGFEVFLYLLQKHIKVKQTFFSVLGSNIQLLYKSLIPCCYFGIPLVMKWPTNRFFKFDNLLYEWHISLLIKLYLRVVQFICFLIVSCVYQKLILQPVCHCHRFVVFDNIKCCRVHVTHCVSNSSSISNGIIIRLIYFIDTFCRKCNIKPEKLQKNS